MGSKPVQILHIHVYSFAVLISIKFCTKLKFFNRVAALRILLNSFVGEKLETFLQEIYEMYNHGSTGSADDPSKLGRMHH